MIWYATVLNQCFLFSFIHSIVNRIIKLGNTPSSFALAPALVETYSRLLVYMEIESLGIKGFISKTDHKHCYFPINLEILPFGDNNDNDSDSDSDSDSMWTCSNAHLNSNYIKLKTQRCMSSGLRSPMFGICQVLVIVSVLEQV